MLTPAVKDDCSGEVMLLAPNAQIEIVVAKDKKAESRAYSPSYASDLKHNLHKSNK